MPTFEPIFSRSTFASCSKIWDGQKFKNATETEIGHCCLNMSNLFVNNCVEICQENSEDIEKCVKECEYIGDSTDDMCELGIDLWGSENPIYKGTDEAGCGDGYYVNIDRKCIKKNKDEVIKVCKKHCIPTSKIDCGKHCNFSYEMITTEPKLIESFKNNIIKTSKSNAGIYILLLGFGLLFVLVFIKMIF